MTLQCDNVTWVRNVTTLEPALSTFPINSCISTLKSYSGSQSKWFFSSSLQWISFGYQAKKKTQSSSSEQAPIRSWTASEPAPTHVHQRPPAYPCESVHQTGRYCRCPAVPTPGFNFTAANYTCGHSSGAGKTKYGDVWWSPGAILKGGRSQMFPNGLISSIPLVAYNATYIEDGTSTFSSKMYF